MLRKDAKQRGVVDRLIHLLVDLVQKGLDPGAESTYQLILCRGIVCDARGPRGRRMFHPGCTQSAHALRRLRSSFGRLKPGQRLADARLEHAEKDVSRVVIK